MNENSIVADAIKLAEGLATAYVNGSASVSLNPISANVAGKEFSLTLSAAITAK